MKKKGSKYEYELCKVCNLNHDQGPRHKYFPNHKKSLSQYLKKFQSKITDIRFFLKNPIPLRPEHASCNRFWCIFCDLDVQELGSSFACRNAIQHLASGGHLKNLKHFMWKYGGEMDRIDVFRVLDNDVAKWEMKCESLKKDALPSAEGLLGPLSRQLVGPLNDIHNEQDFRNICNFRSHTIDNLTSDLSNYVLPLQYHTNECQISHLEPSGIPSSVSLPHDHNSSALESCSHSSMWRLNYLTDADNGNDEPSFQYQRKDIASNGVANERRDGTQGCGGSSSQGFQNLTQVFPLAQGDVQGNVHSGAKPPWLDASDNSTLEPSLVSLVSTSSKRGKSHKLNPKRVGAAWAEKRKVELEMERRGEVVRSTCDSNWLPNFGRVWQSGSRKESRKEFETQKQKLTAAECHQPEIPSKIRPYISKRMRFDVSK